MPFDHFRPTMEPARSIYDALIAEAEHRPGRVCEEWINAERAAVWKVARRMAELRGLRIPTLEEIERAERTAIGHVDYAAKVAYAVSDTMMKGGE